MNRAKTKAKKEKNPLIVIESKYTFDGGMFSALSRDTVVELHNLGWCWLWEAALIILGYDPVPSEHEGNIQNNILRRLPKRYPYICRQLQKACKDGTLPYEEARIENKHFKPLYNMIPIEKLKQWWRETDHPQNIFFQHEYQKEIKRDIEAIFDKNSPCYAYKLALAFKAWQMVTLLSPEKIQAPKGALTEWIENNKHDYIPQGQQLTAEAKKQIVIVSNWKVEGGAPTKEYWKCKNNAQNPFDKEERFYSCELDAVLSAWFAVSQDQNLPGKTIKKKLENWLMSHKDKFFTKASFQRKKDRKYLFYSQLGLKI